MLSQGGGIDKDSGGKRLQLAQQGDKDPVVGSHQDDKEEGNDDKVFKC